MFNFLYSLTLPLNYLFLYLILISIDLTVGQTDDEFKNYLRIKSILTKSYVNNKTEENFIKTKPELDLIKNQPIIIDQKSCNDKHPVSVFIHSASQSSGKYFDKRQTLRTTWVSELKNKNISVYFVIGLNLNFTINQELRTESDKYKDILQFGFIDSYHNLTLKAISVLQWIKKKCQKSFYILKTDDDVVVNTNLLLEKLPQLSTGFHGWVYYKERPPRDPKHKHYMPYEYYPEEYYPDYNAGNSYIMAGNITNRLLDTIDSYTGFVLFNDDLFITGIIAEKAGIGRYLNPELVDWTGCDNICAIHSIAIALECKDINKFRLFWIEFKNTSESICYYLILRDNWLLIVFFVILLFLIIVYLIIFDKYTMNILKKKSQKQV